MNKPKRKREKKKGIIIIKKLKMNKIKKNLIFINK